MSNRPTRNMRKCSSLDADTLDEVIKLAVELEQAHRDYERAHPRPEIFVQSFAELLAEVAHPDYAGINAAHDKLVQHVSSLPLTIARALLAVMYSGRGDGDPADVLDADNAYGHFPTARIAGEQMAGKVPLVEYLKRGRRMVQRYLRQNVQEVRP